MSSNEYFLQEDMVAFTFCPQLLMLLKVVVIKKENTDLHLLCHRCVIIPAVARLFLWLHRDDETSHRVFFFNTVLVLFLTLCGFFCLLSHFVCSKMNLWEDSRMDSDTTAEVITGQTQRKQKPSQINVQNQIFWHKLNPIDLSTGDFYVSLTYFWPLKTE